MLNQILNTIEMAETQNDRQFVTALARGLSLLHAFDANHTSLSHQALCTYSKLPKATVSRLIHTLIQTQFLVQNSQTGQYQIGVNCIHLANSALSQYEIRERAKPLMHAFAERHQVSVSLAIEDNAEMLYLESIRSPSRLAVQLNIGSRVPIETTAIGRVFYAASNIEAQQRIEKQLEQRIGNSVKNIIIKMQKAAELFKEQGYILAEGEFSSDIIAIGIPIFDIKNHSYSYALNASAPLSRWAAKDFIKEIAPNLIKLAKEIEC